ncbi:MAG: WYL domain-containing protein [Cyanobacteriota bacterium]
MGKSTKNIKISTTAYRVLLILHLLNQDKCTLDMLIEALANDKYVTRAFSKETITKYFSTLRFTGFNIQKFNHEGDIYYQLEKSPFTIEFSEDELKALAYIQNNINYLYQPNLINNFNSAISKIERFIDEKSLKSFNSMKKESLKYIKDEYSKFAKLIKLLEEYCIERQSILVTYSPYEELIQKIIIEPEKIEYHNHKVYISGNNPKIQQKQCLQLDYILNIKQLPSKSRQLIYDSTVSFRLTGKLAKGYRLYEGEEIVDKDHSPSSITISASVADIDTLLHRLLRYGQYCEVLSPLVARKKMQDIINQLLVKYQEKLA